MVSNVGSEYGLAYKVNKIYLTVSGLQRQRVKYAVQLLSKSCSIALKFLGEKNLLKANDWKKTSNFISLINDWFGIMNSNYIYGNIPMRNGFGMDIEKQTRVLNEVVKLMNSLRVKSPSTFGVKSDALRFLIYRTVLC